MSFFSKPSISGKMSKAVLGVALLSSLALSACSSPATTAPTDQPSASSSSAPSSASASPSSSIQPADFKSESFDSSKQKSFEVNWSKTNLILADGVVAVESPNDDKTKLTYTPFESPESAWTYTSEVPLTEAKANLMRWKDKSYIVLHGMTGTTQAASGLNSAKTTSTEVVIVLEQETGKVANTLKGDTTSTTGGVSQSGYGTPKLINDKTVPDLETGRATIPDGLYDTEPYMVGLVYGANTGHQVTLVDPLTGKAVAEDTNQYQHYNEAGFWKASQTYSAKSVGAPEGDIDAVFGNYMVVSNKKSGTGPSSTEFRLVNTVTKEVSAPVECADDRKDVNVGLRFSPDFRYVNDYGRLVIDTKTGKAYCQPAGHPEVRPFTVSFVDNDGNMYGAAEKDYLKVNIADTSKSQQWTDGNTYNNVPVNVTSKGSLVIQRSDAGKHIFTVIQPKK